MKKFLALILAAAMLCTMTTVIATAATTTDHLVGNGTGDVSTDNATTNNGEYTDGLAEGKNFPNVDGYEISIMATAGSVEHRYAVDITYDELSFSVSTSSMVWDVNTLEYVVKDGGQSLANETFNVAITNYSDLPVYATVVVTDTMKDENEDGADVAAYVDGEDTLLSVNKHEIEDAFNLAGTENVFNFDIKITSDDWGAVSSYYMAKFLEQGNNNPFVMGTMSITLSKNSN